MLESLIQIHPNFCSHDHRFPLSQTRSKFCAQTFSLSSMLKIHRPHNSSLEASVILLTSVISIHQSLYGSYTCLICFIYLCSAEPRLCCRGKDRLFPAVQVPVLLRSPPGQASSWKNLILKSTPIISTARKTNK